MAQANPIDVPQNFSTTLNVGGGINASQTTGITLTSVTGLPTDGSMLCFDWASPIDTSTYEYIEYTALSGNDLAGTVTRGQEGVSAKSHSNGATVVGVISRAHIKRLRDKLTGNDAVAIQDPNKNSILNTTYVASAVNQVTVGNAATGNAPLISAAGGDTNIELQIDSKGNKQIKLNHALYQGLQSYTPSIGGTATLDLSLGNDHRITMPAGNITIALSNEQVGQKFLISITQDSVGSRTVTWFATIKWAGGSAPTLTTTANKRDTFGFIVTSSGNYDGFVVGQNL